MTPSSLAFNSLLLVSCLALGFVLMRSRLLKSELWQATLTPLSSIIGSGFLIMAPLLASIVGIRSPVAILVIVAVAYAIGHVIRFNILHVEPRIASGQLSRHSQEIEYLSCIALVLAYVVAVAFYLSLLSDFLLHYLGISNPNLERLLTTAIILFITGVGYAKGLGGLERLESFSVTIQLAVIASLIIGLAVFSIDFLLDMDIHFDYPRRDVSTQFRECSPACS